MSFGRSAHGCINPILVIERFGLSLPATVIRILLDSWSITHWFKSFRSSIEAFFEILSGSHSPKSFSALKITPTKFVSPFSNHASYAL